MQTITTKYLPATNCRVLRVRATTESGISITLERSTGAAHSIDADHCIAAQRLKDSLGWVDAMQGGHTKDGMVFVFKDAR